MLFPLCSLKCLLIGRGQGLTVYCQSAWMCVYVREGSRAEEGDIFVRTVLSWLLPFKIFFCFTWLIWISYSFIHTHHTSTYWSFRPLQACGCLINRLLVWPDYLYPVFLFLRELHGWQWGWHQTSSLIYNHVLPFCTTSYSASFPLSSRTTSGFSPWEEMWAGRQSRRLRRGECGFLASSRALTHLTCPQNLWAAISSHCREGLRNLVFLKEGNEPSPD